MPREMQYLVWFVNPLLEPLPSWGQPPYPGGSMAAFFTRDTSIAGTNNTTFTNTIFDIVEKPPMYGLTYNLKRVFSTNVSTLINLDTINKKLSLSVPQDFSDTDSVNVVYEGTRNIQLLSTYESDTSGNWGEIKGKVRSDCQSFTWSGDVDGQHTMRIYYACYTDTNNPSAVSFQATGAEIYVNYQLVASTSSGAEWSQADIVIPRAINTIPLVDVKGTGRIIIDENNPPTPNQWRCYFNEVLPKLTREGNYAGGNWVPQEHFYNPQTGEGVIGADETVTWGNGITLFKQIGSNYWINGNACTRIERV